MVSQKNLSDPVYSTHYQRFCQEDYRLTSSFKYHWAKTRRLRFPGKIVAELSVRRSDHHETGGDLEGACVPFG